MRARWHNTQTARFTSADELFSTNRFNYVAGNPVMMTDPTGMHEIVYNRAGFSDRVKHHHSDKRPLYYFVPIDAFNGLGDVKWDFVKLRDKYLGGSKLTIEESTQLDILQTMGLSRWAYKTIGWLLDENNKKKGLEKQIIIGLRSEFNTNCAGLAFAGMETVYINNSTPPTDVKWLLKYHYTMLQGVNKTSDLKPGDVILQGVDYPSFWNQREIETFNHVRTVVATARKQKCHRSLIYEVDGFNPFVVTYLSRDYLENSVVFILTRPHNRVIYPVVICHITHLLMVIAQMV
jgi:hypothetical protein